MRAVHAPTRPELTPAPTGKRWRYWVGYYCPRGTDGHFELLACPDYDPYCGSKGLDLYLDVTPGTVGLPDGEWRLMEPADPHWRYRVGYYSPRGNFVLLASPDYDPAALGLDLCLDASPGDTDIPAGRFEPLREQR